MIESMRYKLWMMGIPLDGPSNVFCDKDAVCKNVTTPESTLRRKHNSIAFHKVCEAVTANIIRVAKEAGETNLADLLMKPLTGDNCTNYVLIFYFETEFICFTYQFEGTILIPTCHVCTCLSSVCLYSGILLNHLSSMLSVVFFSVVIIFPSLIKVSFITFNIIFLL